MPRQSSGTIEARTLADDSRVFHLRFRANGRREALALHERPGCLCGCGGGWDEPAARTELGNVLAKVRLGLWERPTPSATVTLTGSSGEVPLFSDYAWWWLDAKIDGILGSRPISDGTASDYRWRLRLYLVPFFGDRRIDRIDRDLCLAFKAHLLSESRELAAALEAGADLRDEKGRCLVPLGPSSIRKVLEALAAILDEAIEDEHIEHNPARGKRMRVHVPKPKRTFLEMDELAFLFDAAAEQDVPLPKVETAIDLGPTAALVAHLLAKGLRPAQIAKRLGTAKSTVSHHVGRLGAQTGRGYVGRRVVCEILGRSGVRASELCAIKIGHLRLHDPQGARFRIPDSKTETGIREVQMSPDLVEPVIEHIDRLRRMGVPTGPEDYLVPNLRGTRMSRQRVREIVCEAAALASERLEQAGLSPLPATSPHTLRRTYISIALLANNFDVKWVMSQVGHADSKMTMDVYAQLEQRADRSHGINFDALLRGAREQVASLPGALNGRRKGDEAENEPLSESDHSPSHAEDLASHEGSDEMARPGLEPGTPRFSVVCSTN